MAMAMANTNACDTVNTNTPIQTLTNLWGDNEVAQVKATVLLVSKLHFNNNITQEKVISLLRHHGYIRIEFESWRDFVLSDDNFAILDYHKQGFSGYKDAYKNAMVNSQITNDGVFPILIVERLYLYINVTPTNIGEADYVEEATRQIVNDIH